MARRIDKDAPLPEPEQDSEGALVAAAQAGDRAAFEALYRSHVGRVMALCWRLCGSNPTLAEELAQDAFVRAWQKLDKFRGDSAFGTWLHRLTVNVVLSDRRTRLRRVSREASMDDVPEGDLTAPRRNPGHAMDLEEAIARLPERARTVLVLHDIEGYRHDEVAEIADMAVGTSKAQLHRARRLIRDWMEVDHE